MKQGWEIKRLEDVCEFFNDGNWIESKDQSETGYRLIQTGNIGVGEFRNKSGKERYVSEETFKRLKCTEILEGDILVSRLPDPVGRTCVIPNTGEKMITAVDCSIVRLKRNVISPDYFRYYSQSTFYFNYVAENITGTTRDRISRKNLGAVPIPIPPLPEQQRIVTILDEAFAAIAKAKANAEQNLRNAKEVFESYLQGVFEGKGEGWELKRLADLCTDITVGHVGTMANKYKETGIPFLRSQNIKPHQISLLDVVFIDEVFNMELKKSQLKPGDVAIVRTGYPGTAAVIPENLKVSNCSDLVIVKVGKIIDPYYLCYFFNSTFGKLLVLGNLVGAAQKHFNVTAAKNVMIPVPSIEQQHNIIKKLDTLSAETKKLEAIYQQKINDLEEMKKSILEKAFNGELKTS